MPPNRGPSIFISHTNGDELGELFLKGLVGALKDRMGVTHAGYELMYDRQNLRGGDPWREKVRQWIHACAGAVVLISPQSLTAEKPWVSSELAMLAFRRGESDGVVIMPVAVGTSVADIKKAPNFEPPNAGEFNFVVCEDPSDSASLHQAIGEIADALVAALPALGLPPQDRLTKAVADILSDYPDAYAAMSRVLETAAEAGQIARSLVEQRHGRVMDAIETFHDSATPPGKAGAKLKALRRLCRLIAAAEVPDEAAVQLLLEMEKDPKDARAVLMDTSEPDVSDLYVARAGGLRHERWMIMDLNSVQELNRVVSLRRELLKKLQSRLPGMTKLRAARVLAEASRRDGSPVVFRTQVEAAAECDDLIAAVNDTIPHCGIVLLTPCGGGLVSACPKDRITLLTPLIETLEREDHLYGRKLKFDNLCEHLQSDGRDHA